MDRVALITGASRGIGAATALAAARAGFAVAVNYARDRDAAETVADAVREAGQRAIAVQADVGDEAAIVRMFETVDRDLGVPDALVNNAGILFRQGRLTSMDAARIDRVLAVNVTGTMVCAREAVKRMSTREGGRGGSIVNVSSAAARFTLGLAKEVAAEGIRVNAVRPGIIATDIHASGGEPGRVARVAPNVPMQRGGEPEEVASAIVWLLGDGASYVTGALLDITGGR